MANCSIVKRHKKYNENAEKMHLKAPRIVHNLSTKIIIFIGIYFNSLIDFK